MTELEDFYEEIYDLRRSLGKRKQPDFASFCEHLHRGLPSRTPYEMNKDERDQFIAAHPVLTEGPRGHPAKVKKRYLFRVTTLPRLVADLKNCEISPKLREKALSDINLKADPRILGKQLEQDAEERQWIPLSKYVKGQLRSNRNFAWWTSLELSPDRVVEQALYCGMVTNWLEPWSAILRVEFGEAESRFDTRVPTIVDGFLSPIFHPTVEASDPKSGVTIDISEPRSPKRGVEEYAVYPISAEFIDLWPIELPRSSLSKGVFLRKPPNEPLPPRTQMLCLGLQDYYRNL